MWTRIWNGQHIGSSRLDLNRTLSWHRKLCFWSSEHGMLLQSRRPDNKHPKGGMPVDVKIWGCVVGRVI